ncbi:MAG: hypothetical protein ACOCRO_02985 [Halanaerobiales bacterium]
MVKKAQTSFVSGFNFKGKRESDTGEDLVNGYVAPEGIIPDDEDIVPTGTPVELGANSGEMEVELVSDDTLPEFLLFSTIGDRLTDIEHIYNINYYDEIDEGNPVTLVIPRVGAIITTELFEDDIDTYSLEDSIYIAKSTDENPIYTNDDDSDSRTNEFGKVIGIDDEQITIRITDFN